MRKNRCFKLTALMMAMMMFIGIMPMTASAGTTSNTIRITTGEDTKVLDERFIVSAEMDELSGDADPNETYTLTLKVAEPAYEDEGTGNPDTTLPEDTDKVRMSYELPENVTADNGGNEVIRWVYDAEKGDVVFYWVGAKQSSFTAAITVHPHFPETLGLGGQSAYILYALGSAQQNTHERVMMLPENSSNGLAAAPYDIEGSSTVVPQGKYAKWTFEYVAGNWYTVSSNGLYLNISDSGASVSETAQNLYIMKDGNGKYGIMNKKPGSGDVRQIVNRYNDSGWNRYFTSNNERGNTANLVFWSDVNVKENTGDLTGEWAIGTSDKNGTEWRTLGAGFTYANAVDGADGQIKPKNASDTITTWKFTKAGETNWYTIQNENGQYLSVGDHEASLSSGAAKVYVLKLDDGNYLLTNGECCALRLDGAPTSHANRKLTYIRMNLKKVESADQNEGEPLYNLVEVNGGTWYRLKKTTFKPNVTLEEKVKGLANEKTRTLSTSEYTIDEYYDFTDLTITINNKDYIYYCPQNLEAILAGAKYYTAEFTDVQAVKNKIGGIKNGVINWLIPEKDRYPDKNTTDSFHANYKIKTYDTLEASGLFDDYDRLVFSLNGGTGGETPAKIVGEAGDIVTLPSITATGNNGAAFIGWAETNSFYTVNSGEKCTYHVLYKAGDTYTMRSGTKTLYAVYDTTSHDVRFGVRLDGIIQDEPNTYDVKNYGGHFWMKDVRGANSYTWVIDINPGKALNGHYMENDVIAALNDVPSAEQIAAALKKDGNVAFDPETQYIHWYVLKYTGTEWHIDGVIREKGKIEVSYDANVENANEKTAIENMPGSYQVAVGTEIEIGTEKASNTVLTPVRKGYVFTGWNTKPDGSGVNYSAGRYVRLQDNLSLYAQWAQGLAITITSDWPEGKPAPNGTMIELTAHPSGFEGLVEGVDYILQWRYSTDLQNWIDEPGANAITFTYELNTTTAQYHWKVVAVEPPQK